MPENKLSIDTESDTPGVDPIDDGLATPAFRKELEASAPHLLNKFDSISRNKNDQLEEYGRRYNQAKADLAKNQASAVWDESHEHSSNAFNGGQECSAMTDSNPVLSQPRVRPQKTTRASVRVALSTSSKSDTPSQQPQETTRAELRAPLSTSSRTNTAYSDTSSARAREVASSSEAALTVQIQIRLIPVIRLLTAPKTSLATRAQARSQAHAALRFANENNASPPLLARCSFYIAHATYDRENPGHTPDAVNWFHRATEAAEANYPEGQWAREWLNNYESLQIVSRPGSSNSRISSVSNSVWNAVFRKKNESTNSDSPTALKPRPGFKVTAGERIPSFTTIYSSEGSAKEVSPTSQKSATSSGTQDHYGVKWSPNSPWGKGEVLPGRRFELVLSPEPIYEDEHESTEEEQHFPANVLGGLIEAGALSPAVQRPPAQQQQQQQQPPTFDRRSSDSYIPPRQPAMRKWRIANVASTPSASNSSPSSSPIAPSSDGYIPPDPPSQYDVHLWRSPPQSDSNSSQRTSFWDGYTPLGVKRRSHLDSGCNLSPKNAIIASTPTFYQSGVQTWRSPPQSDSNTSQTTSLSDGHIPPEPPGQASVHQWRSSPQSYSHSSQTSSSSDWYTPLGRPGELKRRPQLQSGSNLSPKPTLAPSSNWPPANSASKAGAPPSKAAPTHQ